MVGRNLAHGVVQGVPSGSFLACLLAVVALPASGQDLGSSVAAAPVSKRNLIAKLDRLTRSVRDLGELLERFQKRGVSLVSVSESLDTGSAAGRLVLNVMASISQWEREAIGERTREALRHNCRTF